MYTKNAVISFTYDLQKERINFIMVDLNKKGEIITQCNHVLDNIHEDLHMNLEGVLEYIEEAHGIKKLREFKIEGFVGDKISFVPFGASNDRSDDESFDKTTFYVNDEEVIEWLHVIKKYLMQTYV